MIIFRNESPSTAMPIGRRPRDLRPSMFSYRKIETERESILRHCSREISSTQPPPLVALSKSKANFSLLMTFSEDYRCCRARFDVQSHGECDALNTIAFNLGDKSSDDDKSIMYNYRESRRHSNVLRFYSQVRKRQALSFPLAFT